MRLLADAGLTTREACGNSVRNITGCPYAGVAADERVRRHAVRRGADALSAAASAQLDAAAQVQDRVRGLRRRSHRAPAINDLGVPRARSARTAARGFRVTAGGGTAIMPHAGGLLHEFLPASEIFASPKRCCACSSALGDYQHKQRNRMKFMIKSAGLGRAGARSTTASWRRCRAERGRCRRSTSIRPPVEARPDWVARPGAVARPRSPRACAAAELRGPGITPTSSRCCRPGDDGVRAVARDQRAAAEAVRLRRSPSPPIPLGDLTSEQMRVLARSRARLRRRHDARHRRSESASSAG